MRLKTKLIIIVCIGVVLCVALFLMQPQLTTYKFSPETSLAFFGRIPEEFFDTYYDYYETCEDFRERAEINEDGYLILKLSKEQEDAFLKSCDSQIEEIKQINGIYISNDYKLLELTGNKNEVAEIIGNEISFLTVFDLANHQLIIDKINPEEVVVKVRVIDENTGKCVYSAMWPKEEVRFSVKDWQFSE